MSLTLVRQSLSLSEQGPSSRELHFVAQILEAQRWSDERLDAYVGRLEGLKAFGEARELHAQDSVWNRLRDAGRLKEDDHASVGGESESARALDRLTEALAKQDERWAEQARLQREEIKEARKDRGRTKSEPRTVFTSKQEMDLPTLAEGDEDLQGHLERFDSTVLRLNDMRGPNAADRLELFGRTLQGSRKTLYNVVHRRYVKQGLLPEGAETCMAEILASFEDDGYAETQLDRETRAIAALEQLTKTQGTAWRMFYAEWLQALSDFEGVGFARCQRQMFIAFLNKFPKQERSKFMHQKSHYDGEFRKPDSWQEISSLAKEHYQNAKEVGYVERVKTTTESELVHAVGRELPSEGKAGTCSSCGLPGHHKAWCPDACAARHGEKDMCKEQFEKAGAELDLLHRGYLGNNGNLEGSLLGPHAWAPEH